MPPHDPSLPSGEAILSRLAELIRSVMNDPDVTITRQTQAIDVKGWDSLSHTFLMLEVERAFKVRFALDDMISLGNVGELADLVHTMLASKGL